MADKNKKTPYIFPFLIPTLTGVGSDFFARKPLNFQKAPAVTGMTSPVSNTPIAKAYRKYNRDVVEDQDYKERLKKYEDERKKKEEKERIEREKKLHAKDTMTEYDQWLENKGLSWMKDVYEPWSFPRMAVAAHYAASDALGLLFGDATGGHMSELSGKIERNDESKYAAQAHLKASELYQRMQNLKFLQQMFAEVNLPDLNSVSLNRLDPQVQKNLETYNKFQEEIDKILELLNNPVLKLLDEKYKADYVSSKRPFFATWGREILHALNSIGTPAGLYSNTEQNYKRIEEENLKKDAAKYWEYLEEELNDRKAGNSAEKDLYKSVWQYFATAEENRLIRGTEEFKKALAEKQKSILDIKSIEDFDRKRALEWQLDKDAENAMHRRDIVDTSDWNQTFQDFFKVSESYKKGMELHQSDSLFSPLWWYYNYPSITGSSNSSFEGSLATGIRGVGLALSIPTGGTSINAAVAVSTPLLIASGFDENYMERAEKRLDNIHNILLDESVVSKSTSLKMTYDLVAQGIDFWQNQGRSEEWIKERYGLTGSKDSLDTIKGTLRSAIQADKVTGDIIPESGKKMAYQDLANGFTKNASPVMQKALVESTAGLEALFWKNNIRTMGELPVQIALLLVPTGRGSKWFDKKYEKLAGKLTSSNIENVGGRVVAKAEGLAATATEKAALSATTYANGFRKPQKTASDILKSGWEAGTDVGDAMGLGYFGSRVTGAIGGASNAVLHATEAILPKKTRMALDKIKLAAMHKYQNVYDKLLPSERARLFAKYGMNTAVNATKSAFSEAAEEGVQYLNSKEDISKYGWSAPSIGDMVMLDIKNGFSVGQAYLAYLGIGNSELLNDDEFWDNVKGGFALGALNTSIHHVVNNAKVGAQQYSTDQLLIEDAVMNREHDKIDRASNVTIAKLAMQGRGLHVLNFINDEETRDSRRENPNFRLEDYDDKRRATQIINSLANDKKLRSILEAKGFEYGTEKYAHALADIYNMQVQRDENNSAQLSTQNSLDALYNDTEFQKQITRITDNSISSAVQIESIKSQQGQKAVDEEIKRIEEAGGDIESKESLRRLLEVRANAERDAVQLITEQERTNVENRSILANRLAALLNIKAKLNTIKDIHLMVSEKVGHTFKQQDAKLIEKHIDDQIKLARAALKDSGVQFGDISDGELLTGLLGLLIATAKSEEMQEQERASALLQAHRAVLDAYYDQLNYGIVRNLEGNLEYNPKEYNARKKKNIKMLTALFSGNMEWFSKLRKEESDAIPYDESLVKDNDYSKKIDAIMKAKSDNEKLDWAISEFYAGDAVTLMIDDYQKQRSEEEAKMYEEALREAKENVPALPKTKVGKGGSLQGKIERSNRKKNAQLEKERKRFLKRKKNLRDFRRSAKATLPFADLVWEAGIYAMHHVEKGLIKFSDFVRRAIYIADEAELNEDHKDYLGLLKQIYFDTKKSYEIKNNQSRLSDFESEEQVDAYIKLQIGDKPEPGGTNPQVTSVQDKLNIELSHVVQSVSTYWDIVVDEGDGKLPYICKNQAEIENHSNTFEKSVERFTQLIRENNTSEDQFRRFLMPYEQELKESINDYIKYREVPGIEEALARGLSLRTVGEFLRRGIVVRDTVVKLMLGKDEEVSQEVKSLAGYDQFKEQIKKLKSLIEGNWTIVDTTKMVYDPNTKLASEIDILLVNKDGNFVIIDVLESYRENRQGGRFEVRPGGDAMYITRNRELSMLKLAEDIIISKFNTEVNFLGVLKVMYEDGAISLEREDDGIFVKIDPKYDQNEQYKNLSIKDIKDLCTPLEERLNELYDEYNDLVQQCNDQNIYVVANERMHFPETEFDTKELLIEYLHNLLAEIDKLLSDIESLNAKLQNTDKQQVQTVAIEALQLGPSFDLLLDSDFILGELKTQCRELDMALFDSPMGVITNDQERANFENLYLHLYLAQLALDRVLNTPELFSVDVTKEEEVIARAMEVISGVTDKESQDKLIIQQWWLTNFVIGPEGVASTLLSTPHKNHQWGYFVNKLDSWINTLESHVLDDLYDRPDLQRWYSILLNNYLKKLAENADTFDDGDDNHKDIIQTKVLQAFSLIERYNQKYPIYEDPNLDGQLVTYERLNSISVEWVNKYGRSTAHTPSYNEMENFAPYWHMSLSPNFEKFSFKFKIADADFSRRTTRGQNSTIKKGQLYVIISDGLGHNILLSFVTDESLYEGKVSEADMSLIRAANAANRHFEEVVKQMIRLVEKDDSLEIVFDVKTNKGSILYGNSLNNVNQFLFSNADNKHDLYTIKLSKLDRLGILVPRIDRSTHKVYSTVLGGDNLTVHIGGFDDEYEKNNLLTKPGTLVYFYKNANGKYIGSPLMVSKIGEDAPKVADLLLRYARGERLYNGYNIEELLKMRVYLLTPSDLEYQKRYGSFKDYSHSVTVTDDGKILIFSESGQPIEYSTNRDALIQRLSNLENTTEKFFLNQNIGTADNSVFILARATLQSLDKVELPNGFIISRDDVTHLNQDGSIGSTFLGYLLRNNIIGTGAVNVGTIQVSFDNVRVLPKNRDAAVKVDPIEGLAKQRSIRRRTISRNTSNDGGLFATVNKEDLVYRSKSEILGFEDEVNAYFDEVLSQGKDYFKSMLDDFIKELPDGKVVIGQCTADAIRMCSTAPIDVAWHEAFHKITELLLSEKERGAMYSAYRNHIKDSENMSERQIAEELCDMYVEYMHNRYAYKGAKGLKKITAAYKRITFAIGLMNRLGLLNSYKYIQYYRNINKGKYKTRTLSKEALERFIERFGKDGLFYTVENFDTRLSEDFKYLANSGDVRDMVKALSYYIIDSFGDDVFTLESSKIKINSSTLSRLPKETIDILCAYVDENGEKIPEEELNEIDFAYREIFEDKIQKPIINKKTGETVGYKPVYPKFEILSKRIADYIESIISDYRDKIKEVDDEDEKVARINIDKFDRASYEFNRLDGTTPRVRLFLSTIPYTKFRQEEVDGKTTRVSELDYSKNKYLAPTFMPIAQVLTTIVADINDPNSEMYGVDSLDALDTKLEKMSRTSSFYETVYNKYHEIYEKVYNRDPETGDITIDYDAESLAAGLVQLLTSQNIHFIIARSRTLNFQNGKTKVVRIIESSLERDSRTFATEWSKALQGGIVPIFNREKDANGNYILNAKYGNIGGLDVFKYVSHFIFEMQSFLNSGKQSAKIYGTEYNRLSTDNIENLKDRFINALNLIGINFTKDALDYMLMKKFGDVGVDGFTDFLNIRGLLSINSFTNNISNFINTDGVPDKKKIDEGYRKIGFVGLLAEWQGAYDRITIHPKVFGLNGKTLYPISLNNAITQHIRDLNTNDSENPLIRVLRGFSYNLMILGGLRIGSIILKNAAAGLNKIESFVYNGFKTDNRGDGGTEYKKLADAEYYMSKLEALQEGYLVFPVLESKSTYVMLKGVPIPGMKFVESYGGSVSIQNGPSILWIKGRPYIKPNSTAIQQMIEYAYTEAAAIEECMYDLGYEGLPNHGKNPNPIPDEYKVLNYHTSDKSGVEPNGTRFMLLTEIVVEDKDGNLITHNLNDPNEKSIDLLKKANDLFFSKSREEQERIMILTLNKLFEEELKYAIELGIVSRENIQEGSSTIIDESEESIMNLLTQHLEEPRILALTKYIFNSIPEYANMETGNKKNARYRICRSLAIAALISDCSLRSIISSQEVLRCFSGHIGQYKARYDKNEGVVEDNTFDLQKRLGGLVSTGEDNVQDLNDVGDEYNCAECKDYKIKSESDVVSRLDELFINGEVREVYATLTGDWKRAYDKKVSIEELIEEHPELELDRLNAIKYSQTIQSGINVADGAAYITLGMTRKLLRQRSVYSEDIKRALDILEGDEKYSWRTKKDAFDLIYKTLNLVTYKYTAFGFRPHEINGKKVSNMAVSYFNKYALFPMVPSMNTGVMSDIYDKMLKQKVDCLLMTSAVKVGSCGAVEFDGKNFKGDFNVYSQRFSDLRRLQNTDPEDIEDSNVGSQALKVALQNLRTEREYVLPNGNIITGQQLLDFYMDSISKLSQIGRDEIIEKFSSDGLTIDEKKLSDYLKQQLSGRNSSTAILKALDVYKENGVYKMKAPIAATSDSSWIESIVISLVNDHVISVQTPGSSYVQRSVFAMEDRPGNGKILSDKDEHYILNGGKRLLMLNDDGSMDAVISIDYFENILPKDLSFDEARQWLIDHEIIGEKAKANTIGYRIPTLAQSSIHALRFVDVVAGGRNTIILPAEFVKITGSDFDIDHLYLMSYNYNIDENGDITKDFDVNGDRESRKRHYQNNLMDMLMALLKDYEFSMHMLYRSIDSDTEPIEAIARLIKDPVKTKHLAYNFGTMHELSRRRGDYTTGEEGIGPQALNITNQVFTYLYNVAFRRTYVTQNTPISHLHHLRGYDGRTILSWLSGFLNGNVDIIKDPYVSKLNTNSFTYNVLNLLLRSGFGDAAVWFLCLPIIRDMSAADKNSNSEFMRDFNVDKSKYKTKLRLINEAILKYMSPDEIKDEIYKFGSDNAAFIAQADAIQFIIEKLNVLKEIAKNPTAETVVVDDTIYDVREVLKKVFYAWQSLLKYSIALNNLVLYTKIDTKKHGKSLIAIERYMLKYLLLINDDPKTSIFDMNTILNFVSRSWVNEKTELATSLPKWILGKSVYNANQQFMDLVLAVAYNINLYDNDDNLNNLSKLIQTLLKSQYIIKYAKEFLDMSDLDITNLFVGDFTINKRLNGLQYFIKHIKEFQRLSNNPLLNSLRTASDTGYSIVNGKQIDNPEFITVLGSVEDSSELQDLVSDGWLDLLNDEHPRVRKFARDLIVYAYLTSGEYSGWDKLFKMVPPEWILGDVDHEFSSFSLYISDQLSSSDFGQYEDAPLTSEEVVLNNTLNYQMVRSVSKTDETGRDNFVSSNHLVLVARPDLWEDVESIPPYISVKKPGTSGYGQACHDVYEYVTSYTIELDGIVFNYPVFARIKAKGYSDSRKNTIFEYGWNFLWDGNGNETARSFDYMELYRKVIHAVPVLSKKDVEIKDLAKLISTFKEIEISNSDKDSIGVTEKETLKITPIQLADKKATAKGSISNKFIGFGDGIEGSSTAEYARQAGNKANVGNYGVEDTVFVSIPGKRGNEEIRHREQLKTIDEALKALRLGATLVTDNAEYTNNSSYNEGEKKLAKALSDAGATYSERTVDGHVLGIWKIEKVNIYQTMREINIATLQQHPEIVERITQRGGEAYLKAFIPDVTEDGYLEANEYILGLIEAYNNVLSNTGKLSQLRAELGDDEIGNSEIEDALAVAQSGMPFEDALKTVSPVFTKDEIDLIKRGLNGKNLQVMSVSRATDPAFFEEEIIEFLKTNAQKSLSDPTRIVVMELWTKHDGTPIRNILKACRKYKVAPMVSFSVTGMGGTAIEPGVMRYDDMLDRINDLIAVGALDPRTTTIRIDPILPGYTDMEIIKDIVSRAKIMGIKKFVTSLMQSYGYTENKIQIPIGNGRYEYIDLQKPESLRTLLLRFPGLNISKIDFEVDKDTNKKLDSLVIYDTSGNVINGTTQNGFYYSDRKVISGINKALSVENSEYDWEKYYGKDSTGRVEFRPKLLYIDEVGYVLLELDKDPSITIQTCAFFIKGLKVSACLDPKVIETVTGVSVTNQDGSYLKDPSRKLCWCYGCHGDLFKWDRTCLSSCAYCYAAHSNDAAFTYYDESGNLIDNEYTRVLTDNELSELGITSSNRLLGEQNKNNCKG